MAIVAAAHGVYEVAAKSDERAILVLKTQFDRRDVKPLLNPRRIARRDFVVVPVTTVVWRSRYPAKRHHPDSH
jgi:hypothetical protein